MGRSWGTYATYFLPRKPTCRPPPPNIVVPCPHQVPHLLVAHSTTTATFGHAFTDFFEDARKMRVQRQHKIFALARSGYEALFRLRLSAADEEAVELRKKQLEEETGGNEKVLAVQIRRGDGKDKAFEWRETGHVPVSHYADLISSAAAAAGGNATVLLSSDDPEIYSLPEFANYIPAQSLPPSPNTRDLLPGGWTRQAFENARASEGGVVDLAREYFRDVKILGETTEKLFCGGNGNTCRVMAVVMGWQKAVEEEGWVNVDDGRGWFGVDW